MNKIIAITIGDINGIGIDILVKTWKERKIKNFVLVTNINIFNKSLRKRKIDIFLNLVNHKKNKFVFLKNIYYICKSYGKRIFNYSNVGCLCGCHCCNHKRYFNQK